MTSIPATARRGRKSSDGSWTYRLNVATRALAAILGGFGLASCFAWAVSAAVLHWGMEPRGPAIGTGTLLSWIVWTCGAMWAFYAPYATARLDGASASLSTSCRVCSASRIGA